MDNARWIDLAFARYRILFPLPPRPENRDTGANWHLSWHELADSLEERMSQNMSETGRYFTGWKYGNRWTVLRAGMNVDKCRKCQHVLLIRRHSNPW